MVDVAAIRQRFSAVAPFLNERGRRVVAAAEARRQDTWDRSGISRDRACGEYDWSRLAGVVCA